MLLHCDINVTIHSQLEIIDCVRAGGSLVINPFDPSARMQQWLITERKIQNRHHPGVVLEVRPDTSDVTSNEYSASELQLWSISHVYVTLLMTVSHSLSQTLIKLSSHTFCRRWTFNCLLVLS